MTPDPHQLLEKYFGFREFLDAQEEVIGSILAGHDSLVVMPTGGGKSLCYQLPALMLEGVTIVVSPAHRPDERSGGRVGTAAASRRY